MTKPLNCRLPDALVDEIQQAADAQRLSISEVVRRALVIHLGHNSEIYEIIKTRAVLLRFLDTQLETTKVEKMIALAEEDATEYLKKREEKDNG
jgi:hypothetical protein